MWLRERITRKTPSVSGVRWVAVKRGRLELYLLSIRRQDKQLRITEIKRTRILKTFNISICMYIKLPPIVFAQSLLAFLNVADHSVGQLPMAVVFGWYAVYNLRGSPTTYTYLVAIPRIMKALRLCCQLFQNLVRRPADSRPAPIHEFRRVKVLSRPFHINQIQTVCNVGVVAFPTTGVVPHHRILCEEIFNTKKVLWSSTTSKAQIRIEELNALKIA